jgi:hypothetical protein
MIQFDDSDRSLSEAHERGEDPSHVPIGVSVHATEYSGGSVRMDARVVTGVGHISIASPGGSHVTIFLNSKTSRQLAAAALKLAEKIEQASRPLSGVATGERGGES